MADRHRIERRFERAVREHRFTIAVVFPTVGAGLMLAGSAGVVPTWLAFSPIGILFGAFVMRSPLLAGIAPLVDRRAGLSLVALGGYAYVIEFVGVTTGRPYGAFEYGIALGPMLFDAVPLALPLFFVPLALNAYLLCLLLLGPVADLRRYRLPAAVAATVAIDLVLDPAAVALGFWSYAGGGAYYGVPLSNYAGWALSATVAVAAIDAGFDRRALRERLERCEFALDDLASFLILWGLVNVAVGNWIPAGVVGAFAAAMLATGRIDASAGIAKYDPRLGR